MSKPPLPFPRGARTVGKTTFLLVALLTVAVVVGLFAWVVVRAGNQPQGAQFLVGYRVSGSAAQATVVYDRPDGQHSETVDLPWSTSFDTGSGTTLSLVARATDGSSITCAISENGQTITTQSGSDCFLQAGS